MVPGEFKKKKDYLICVDSDGCAMDTMKVKHEKCFGPCLIEVWGLEPWREKILDRWNEVNLFSGDRGINRFRGLYKALEEIRKKYVPVGDTERLRDWILHTEEFSEYALEKESIKSRDPVLKKALVWSRLVNEKIRALPDEELRPFDGVKETLQEAGEWADIAVVSSANPEAVQHEWKKHGLSDYVDILLTQEAGSKECCIRELAGLGYDRKKAVMLGDAPGDYRAARSCGILFFPILAGKEADSWEEFRRDGFPRFLEGRFDGTYQEEKIREFTENLE